MLIPKFNKTCWVLVLNVLLPIIICAQVSKPNFVFFITDDIGWADLGCYGNPDVRTPNIDRLANKGLKFENVYLTTSSCSPSRCSIITGRYPHNTGAPELHDTLPAGQVMFPQLLKQSGYYTVLSGKNHMGPVVKQAFDKISSGRGPGGEEDWVSILRERLNDKPFFFWFASHDAHRDWQFNDKGVQYDPEDIEVPVMLYDGPQTRKDLAGYYHEISRADYYLGELMKELERQGILETTYIIFMSDNGSPFPRNKGRLYDSGIKTPFIVYSPNVAKGRTSALISTLDIAPTLLTLAGVEIPKDMQGLNVDVILKDSIAESPRDFIFAEHNWHVFQAHERMVRYKDWVYIRNAYPGKPVLVGESTRQFPAGRELWNAHEAGKTKPYQQGVFTLHRGEELFHVASDPNQFNNIIAKEESREMLKFLRKVMDQWIVETGDSVPGNPTPDRDDLNGKRLRGGWKKGEKPGASEGAKNIIRSGPVNVWNIR